MRWGRKKKDQVALADEARQILNNLRLEIKQNIEAQEWGKVDNDMLKVIKLLHGSSRVAPVTQSTLAELYGQWGLSMMQQKRYEEGEKHLKMAQKLFNMEYEAAVAWAANQKITMQGQGEDINIELALEVLKTLADRALRQGQSNAGEMLEQTVKVADILGDHRKSWDARERLSTFTAGAADWQTLLDLGRQMGALSMQQRNLSQLFFAMRQLSEASLGLKMRDQSLDVQQLVVDIARYLNDPSLPNEENELSKLRDMAW